MRLRHDKEALNKVQNSGFYIENTHFPIKLDHNSVLEIGMGKGEMLVELARLNPAMMFYGLEKYATVAAKCLKKASEYNLQNFKIILENAQNIDQIFSGYLNTIWLTFSDPWPKARHENRRLTHKSFLEKYASIMDENSVLKFKSDNDLLYNYSLESFSQNYWNIIDFGQNLHQSIYAKDNVMTGYESKWRSLGKNINFIIAKPQKK
ncbi:tRNA (guanosine(46)-N7)-methyltransferase TrmB [Mycoplasmopsis mucosicanis]|uniref:tRNA (guanine-N(7)-)-methyltransferase n=1 Tax=Mycoplasmopsis mucosicanis TaxID=458208 RepID=A0A507SMN2_9BACT|nr:tRNA (guanosine(46)-N7)-methyltransferase TrmB [Mycoplasmopsis mucosicanis]TQC51284.1 tRNA (guanosine(46)-N7)-methyltransferase TrmB [Mycoplasmopsis mucosicanis]